MDTRERDTGQGDADVSDNGRDRQAEHIASLLAPASATPVDVERRLSILLELRALADSTPRNESGADVRRYRPASDA